MSKQDEYVCGKPDNSIPLTWWQNKGRGKPQRQRMTKNHAFLWRFVFFKILCTFHTVVSHQQEYEKLHRTLRHTETQKSKAIKREAVTWMQKEMWPGSLSAVESEWDLYSLCFAVTFSHCVQTTVWIQNWFDGDSSKIFVSTGCYFYVNVT